MAVEEGRVVDEVVAVAVEAVEEVVEVVIVANGSRRVRTPWLSGRQDATCTPFGRMLYLHLDSMFFILPRSGAASRRYLSRRKALPFLPD